jgi:hypothetical protein
MISQETLDLFLKIYMGYHPWEETITFRHRSVRVLMCEKGKICSIKRLQEMTLPDLVRRLNHMQPMGKRVPMIPEAYR